MYNNHLTVYIWRLFRCPANCVQYRSMPIHSGDWRSYDQIAKDYDRVWATRFARVARGMADMMPAGCAPRVLLDIEGPAPESFRPFLPKSSERWTFLQAAIYHSVCFNKQRRGSQTSLVVIGQKSRQPL